MGKKKGGKPKKNYEPTPEEIAAMEELKVREELDNTLMELNYTLKQEQDDFNEFQQQREKLNYFWIVEKKNFKKVDFFKPESSRSESKETYIICSALKSL